MQEQAWIAAQVPAYLLGSAEFKPVCPTVYYQCFCVKLLFTFQSHSYFFCVRWEGAELICALCRSPFGAIKTSALLQLDFPCVPRAQPHPVPFYMTLTTLAKNCMKCSQSEHDKFMVTQFCIFHIFFPHISCSVALITVQNWSDLCQLCTQTLHVAVGSSSPPVLHSQLSQSAL